MDDLARWVASPVSRRRALKLGAGAFAGMTMVSLRPGNAFAQRGDMVCSPDTKYCFAWTCPNVGPGRPLGSTCCRRPHDPHIHTVCPSGDCCDPCNPFSSRCGSDGYCYPGPVNGSCPCTPASGGVKCGPGDCCFNGLVCCDFIFSTKENFKHCCTPEHEEKGHCKDMKYLIELEGLAVGAVAVFATGGAVLVFFAVGAGLGVGHVAADVCADDPPDPNFKALFVPTVPRLPRVRAGKELTPKAVRALRGMTANYLRYGAYAIAWIRSREKAQGAAQANDTQWARRHRLAAAKYARTAASALERDHRLRITARDELRRAGFRHFKITPAQARNWQRQIKAHGLPSQMEHILREAKVDKEQRQALRHDLLQMDPMVVAHLGLFGELDDKRFQQANTAMVRSMRQSASLLSAGA